MQASSNQKHNKYSLTKQMPHFQEVVTTCNFGSILSSLPLICPYWTLTSSLHYFLSLHTSSQLSISPKLSTTSPNSLLFYSPLLDSLSFSSSCSCYTRGQTLTFVPRSQNNNPKLPPLFYSWFLTLAKI